MLLGVMIKRYVIWSERILCKYRNMGNLYSFLSLKYTLSANLLWILYAYWDDLLSLSWILLGIRIVLVKIPRIGISCFFQLVYLLNMDVEI